MENTPKNWKDKNSENIAVIDYGAPIRVCRACGHEVSGRKAARLHELQCPELARKKSIALHLKRFPDLKALMKKHIEARNETV